MKKYLCTLRDILEHKWHVFVECCKLGIPFLGIVHDLSKLLPRELFAYSWSFSGPWPYENRPRWLVDAFDVAWLHHQKGNRHHWQYWMLVNMGREDRMLPMPDRYRREMLADWLAFSKARGKYAKDALEKFSGTRDSVRLHSETEEWVLGKLAHMVTQEVSK